MTSSWYRGSIIWLILVDLYHSSNAVDSVTALVEQSSDGFSSAPSRSCRMSEQILENCDRTDNDSRDGVAAESLSSMFPGGFVVGRKLSLTSYFPCIRLDQSSL